MFINFGGRKKKTIFLFVFSTYIPVFLLKIRVRALVECGIKFHVQRVPTLHTFDGPFYPKNKKYLKNVMMMSSSCFLRYFLFLGQCGPSKVCSMGTRWMRDLIPHPMSSLDRNLSKRIGIYVENTNKKVVFFILPPNLITIILLFSLGGPFQTSNFL